MALSRQHPRDLLDVGLLLEAEQPDFGLIGLAHAADLPGVRRKLHNLAQRTAAKRAADRGQLAEVLARIKVR